MTALLLSIMLASAPVAQPRLPQSLAVAVRAYDAAQINGDRVALERLLADDYVLINSSGSIESKQALIRDYTAPGFKLEPFTVTMPIEKAWSNGAVFGGIVTLRGVDNGKRFEAILRFADVWARRAGRWQVIYTHANRIPPKK